MTSPMNIYRPLRMASAALFFYEAAQILQVQAGQWAWTLATLFMALALVGMLHSLWTRSGDADTSPLSVFNSLFLALMVAALAGWKILFATDLTAMLIDLGLCAGMFFLSVQDARYMLRLRQQSSHPDLTT